MTKTHNVDIVFFLDGERYASRYWPQVPRVGDEVMLYDKAQPKRNDRHDKAPFKVTRVVWGTEGPNTRALEAQSCNVEIERTS